MSARGAGGYFASPTPSYDVSSSVSSRDHHQQWAPEFTPLSDVIDEISRLRQEFSRDVTAGANGAGPLAAAGHHRRALVSVGKQQQPTVAAAAPPSYGDTIARRHMRPRKQSVTSNTSSSTSPQTVPSLASSVVGGGHHHHHQPVTSLKLTITRPDGVVRRGSDLSEEEEDNGRMVIV